LGITLGANPRNGLIQEDKCENVFEDVNENETLSGDFLMEVDYIGEGDVWCVDFSK
jgi:hypothetical protein